MDLKLIENWNEKVPTDGLVYHLGDMFFKTSNGYAKKIIDSLNGRIVQLKGNHDHIAKKIAGSFSNDKYEFINSPYMDIQIDDFFIILCHYPIISWHRASRGSLHLHGHCHNTLLYNYHKLEGPMLDVGVDTYAQKFPENLPENYKPFSFQEVIDLLKEKAFKNKDHHEKN